jgi:hypothetical protein
MALHITYTCTLQLLLSTVAAERNGEMVDTSLMRSALSMLVDSGVESPQVYVEEFETDFLNNTENFYSKESFECLSKSTCPEYLVKVGSGPHALLSFPLRPPLFPTLSSSPLPLPPPAPSVHLAACQQLLQCRCVCGWRGVLLRRMSDAIRAPLPCLFVTCLPLPCASHCWPAICNGSLVGWVCSGGEANSGGACPGAHVPQHHHRPPPSVHCRVHPY